MELMIYYILVVLSALGNGINFGLIKWYQTKRGNTLETGAIFNCLVGLIGTVLYFVICGFKVAVTPFSLVIAILFTIFAGMYARIGFKVMSLGSMAVYTTFLMLGGMILPYFYGLIFLGEKITVLKVVALLMMIFAIILQNSGDKKKGRALFYVLCVAVFMLNGGVSVVSKMHQINTEYTAVSENGFVLLKNIMTFILYGAMIPFVAKDKKKALHIKPVVYIIIALSTVVGNLAYFCQLVGSTHLPATIQFPIISGGTIVFSALTGLIFFKEHITKRQILSLVICIASMVLIII